MPELPEVETVRRQLAGVVEGARLSALEVLDARWCAPQSGRELEDALVGRRVVELGRRGKYLDWRFEDELHLLMHLRMTGGLLLDGAGEGAPAYARVRIGLGARTLWFVDPRRFGTGMLVVGDAALERYFGARLGVEPFAVEFDGGFLRARARGRRGAIKPFLLDQRGVVGVGNIYADEALFRARLHPERAAGSLSRGQYDALAAAVRAVLAAGIDARGASIDDFRDLDGMRGSFQDRFMVHRREGLPCPECGTAITKIVVGGRGTYFCQRCQVAGRGPTRRAAPAGPSGRPRAAR
jgi:formamidopyrimidine-DNA glycosylase